MIIDLDGVLLDVSKRRKALEEKYPRESDFYIAWFKGEERELISPNIPIISKILNEKEKLKGDILVLTGTVFLDPSYEDYIKRILDKYLKLYDLFSRPERDRYSSTPLWKKRTCESLVNSGKEIIFTVSDKSEETDLISELIKKPKKRFIWSYLDKLDKINLVYGCKKS